MKKLLTGVALLSTLSAMAQTNLSGIKNYVNHQIDNTEQAVSDPGSNVYNCFVYSDEGKGNMALKQQPMFKLSQIASNLYVNQGLTPLFLVRNDDKNTLESFGDNSSIELKSLKDGSLVGRLLYQQKNKSEYYICPKASITEKSPVLDALDYLTLNGPMLFLSKYEGAQIGKCKIEKLQKKVGQEGTIRNHQVKEDVTQTYGNIKTRTVRGDANSFKLFNNFNILVNDKNLFTRSYLQELYHKSEMRISFSEERYFFSHDSLHSSSSQTVKEFEHMIKNQFHYQRYSTSRLAGSSHDLIRSSADMQTKYSEEELSKGSYPEEEDVVNFVSGLLISGECSNTGM